MTGAARATFLSRLCFTVRIFAAMTRVRQHGGWRALLAVALAVVFLSSARAEEYIRWDKNRQRVEANVASWDVVRVLQRVSALTGWKIYLQPDTEQRVPTRFRDLSEGEALRRLLGDLNFMLVPRTNAPDTLYVFRTSRRDATDLVRAEASSPKTKPIADEVVVVLNPGESIEELARRLGAEVVGKIGDLNAYRLKFKDADSARRAREALADDSRVASVQDNYPVRRPDSPEGIGLSAPPFNIRPKAPPDGQYVIVGLIDSAVQANAGRFSEFLLEPISVAGKAVLPSDQPTHGTGMAESILNGMASILEPGASTTVRILNVDVYGGNPTTSTFEVAAGIARAIEAGARIINLSMAGDAPSPIMHEVIKVGRAQGIPFFAAPGNEPVSTPMFPAAYPEVTSVTALAAPGQLAEWANRSGKAEAAAPGSALITFNGDSYVITGTSAATAFASGAAAAMVDSKLVPANKVDAAIQKVLPVPRR